jgi:nitrogen fixation/metabolism regulation signal transduction histidine kinase
MNDPTFAESLEARSKGIDAAFDAESTRTLQLQSELVAQQKVTFWALVGALMVFIVLTALIAIVITHRIVGPLFRIKRMAREVGSGVMRPPTYGLRPGDELQDVFDIFAKMITELRARTEADQRAVDAALGGDQAALIKLKAELEARLAVGRAE